MYCIKATSKRSSLSGGSRHGGIVGEAAWEVKKSAGGEECRKRLLTPSTRIDTFLRARLGSRRRGTCVIHRECQSVGWSAAPSTCARLAFSILCFLRVGHEKIGPRDCPQMKFQWKVFTAPLFKVPTFIPVYCPSMYIYVEFSNVEFTSVFWLRIIKKRASLRQRRDWLLSKIFWSYKNCEKDILL